MTKPTTKPDGISIRESGDEEREYIIATISYSGPTLTRDGINDIRESADIFLEHRSMGAGGIGREAKLLVRKGNAVLTVNYTDVNSEEDVALVRKDYRELAEHFAVLLGAAERVD